MAKFRTVVYNDSVVDGLECLFLVGKLFYIMLWVFWARMNTSLPIFREQFQEINLVYLIPDI